MSPETNTISVGNCPDCNHFPTQFIEDGTRRHFQTDSDEKWTECKTPTPEVAPETTPEQPKPGEVMIPLAFVMAVIKGRRRPQTTRLGSRNKSKATARTRKNRKAMAKASRKANR